MKICGDKKRIKIKGPKKEIEKKAVENKK